MDPSVQACLIADKHPIDVVKDVGIKASGKLQLLDAMLSEIKTRGLRVLILYQVTCMTPLFVLAYFVAIRTCVVDMCVLLLYR